MLKQTAWMPQHKAESVPFFPDVAFISITEPQRPDANLHQSYADKNRVLRLRFNDADESGCNMVAGYEYDRPVLFTEEQAIEILDFVEGLDDEVRVLLVHCHAGISRSAAVAIALAEMFGLKETYPHYKIYNKLVYRKIQLAWADRHEDD